MHVLSIYALKNICFNFVNNVLTELKITLELTHHKYIHNAHTIFIFVFIYSCMF